MSLNALPRAQPSPQIGETTLSHASPADLELRIPATIEGPKRTEYAKGRLWVTDQRVVFISDADGPVVSLAIPYTVLLSSKFNLPLLSANNISIAFLPDPLASAPTLPSPGRGASLEAKLVLNDGSGHGVWKAIEGNRGRWAERRQRDEEEDLPAYTS